MSTTLKTRFAPSPTGHLHVGNARTALFNYLWARHNNGKFLLRIEDTDRERHQEDAVGKILADLRWLGIEWDEGLEVGGSDGPYRQSERLEIFRSCIQKLLDAGQAYYAFDTSEELDALRKEAEAKKTGFRYRRPDPLPTEADARKAREDGRPVVVRLLCPAADVTIQDDAFGQVTMPAAEMDDFVLLKADGYPTYHAANVIDDGLMGVTYIMRGQEFLGQTWRHVLLRRAWGFPEPGYCHLPLILDMAGKKLSKRDGDVEVHAFRAAGYLPEVLANFIALLGWSPSGDVEKMSPAEMIQFFSVERIGKTNAKFDRKKLVAFNTDACAAAPEDRLLAGLKDYLSLNPGASGPIPTGDDELLRRVLRATKGFRTFADVPAKCGVLFSADDSFPYDEQAVAKVLRKSDGEGFVVLAAVRDVLAAVPLTEWSGEVLDKALEAFCTARGLGMGKVAQPIRVAVTGATISPGIAETLLFLGRDKTLARIDRCLKLRGA
jgi:glutamyl-tRNA synthetase